MLDKSNKFFQKRTIYSRMKLGDDSMYPSFYLKTENSLLKSMIQIPSLIEYAKEHGMKALALADERMYGALEFYMACTKNDIKPIIGLEITIRGMKLLLYCQNNQGYQNLLKLGTLLTEHDLTITELKQYHENLLCVVPFDSRSLYSELSQVFESVWEGYETLDEKKLLQSDNQLYLNEVLCLKEEDQAYLPYLEAIRRGDSIDMVSLDRKKHFIDLNPTMIDSETIERFQNLCNVELVFHQDLLPIYECPDGKEALLYLKELCIQGLKRIFGEKVQKVYIDRLKYELDVIGKMGFCNYFLVVWDYVKYAKQEGILVGPGRGSAAGSLVSYCLDITTVDPITYSLIFERFLNPERITMPDIDIDFEFQRRGDVISYCISKYGEKKVAPIITFGTMGAKQVVRDVGRVLEIDLKSIDFLSRMLDAHVTLKENYRMNEKLRDYLNVNQEMKQLYQIALKLEGLKRHTSIHAAGVVMCNRDLDEVIPLDKNHEGFYTTAYSMEYLEELGLLKMDFLALRNLTTIHNILKEIKSLSFDEIPFDDKKALNIFTTVNTIGIFQFESDGMMNFIRKFRPTTFEDVIAAIALFRPGPMANIDSYIKRKHGKEKIDYLDPSLLTILKPTYGVIIYQEQIMQIANTLAGYSFGEADVLRRAMSKKKEEVLLSEKDKFVFRSTERGYLKEKAEKVYQLILKFASYGFNRSHSVAYAFISYRMAYLKAHYPNIFMKQLLSSVIGSEIKTKEYIYECKLNQIAVLKPDINQSGMDYQIEETKIRYPLTNIRNLGVGVVGVILEERKKGLFVDIFDFVKRCYGKSVNRKVLESLIYAGAFQSFQRNQSTLLYYLDDIINYGEVGALLDEESLKPIFEELPELPKGDLMKQELSVFGFYLSSHPVTEYRLKYPNTVTIGQLDVYFDKHVEMIIYVDKVKEISTKRNEKMCFITGSDEIDSLDIVIFPRLFGDYPELSIGDVIKVAGKVEKRFDKFQLIVNQLEILKDN